MQTQNIFQTYLAPINEKIEQEPVEFREFKPRLGYYQSLLSRDNPDQDQIIDYFKEWVNCDEYLVFRKENKHTLKKEYKAVKAAKRGNDVYSYKLNKRLRNLDNLPQIQFFNYKTETKNKSPLPDTNI